MDNEQNRNNQSRNENNKHSKKDNLKQPKAKKMKKVHKKPQQVDTDKQYMSVREKFTEKLKETAFHQLISLLKNCTNDSQVPNIINKILLPNPERFNQVKQEIERDLYEILRFGSYEFRVYNFGSAVTGLAFQGSDLDYFVHCSENDTPVVNLINEAVKRSRQTGKFQFVCRIINARVPLLRLRHLNTNLELDVNFSSPRGCYNSQYLKFLLNYDPRIFQLAVIIKYWGLCANVSGKCPNINNYTLILLLIFFCQNLPAEQKLLPALEVFQYNLPENNYGQWNYAFNMDFTSTNTNRMNIRQLLLEFFKFYSVFDFQRYIVSTAKGRCYDRVFFHNLATVPAEFGRYIVAVRQHDYPPINLKPPLCIQDPFELNFNVGSIVPDKIVKKFIKYAQLSHMICTQSTHDTFANVLIQLFTQKIIEPDEKEKPIKIHVEHHAFEAMNSELQMVKNILLLKEKDRIYTTYDIHKNWQDSIVDFIEDILEKLFLMTVTPVTARDEICEENWNVLKTLHLISKTDVWSYRKRMKITDMTSLEREMKISNNLRDANNNAIIDCTLILYTKPPKMEDPCSNSAPKLCMLMKGLDLRKGVGLRSFFKNGLLINIRNCIEGYFKIFEDTASEYVNKGPEMTEYVSKSTDVKLTSEPASCQIQSEVKENQDHEILDTEKKIIEAQSARVGEGET